MMPFRWVDRYGVVHELASPVPIGEEVEAISDEIDQALGRIEDASSDRKRELRLIVRNHALRLQQLQSDAERWNCSAYEQLDAEAAELADYIDQLLIEVQPMMIIAVLHQENEKMMGDTQHRERLLDGGMTTAQRMAVARSTLKPKPGAEATRRETHEWLKSDPDFYRPRFDEGGWFEWHDSEGVLHRLLSPRRIEEEIAGIAHNLRKILPALRGEETQNDKASAFEIANSAIKRLSILQLDLERFAKEQDAKEEEEWQLWESEWKKSRPGK